MPAQGGVCMLTEQTGLWDNTSLPGEGSNIPAMELYSDKIIFACQLQEFFYLPGADGYHQYTVL